MRIVGTALLSRGGVNQVVCTGAMAALINAVGTRHPLDSVRRLLLNGIETHGASNTSSLDADAQSKQEEKQITFSSTPANQVIGGGNAGASNNMGASPYVLSIPAVVSERVSDYPIDAVSGITTLWRWPVIWRRQCRACGNRKTMALLRRPSSTGIESAASHGQDISARSNVALRTRVSLTLRSCVTHPTDNLQRATALASWGVASG